MRNYVILCAFLLLCANAYAQQAIMTKDGKVYRGRMLYKTTDSVVFEVTESGRKKVMEFPLESLQGVPTTPKRPQGKSKTSTSDVGWGIYGGYAYRLGKIPNWNTGKDLTDERNGWTAGGHVIAYWNDNYGIGGQANVSHFDLAGSTTYYIGPVFGFRIPTRKKRDAFLINLTAGYTRGVVQVDDTEYYVFRQPITEKAQGGTIGGGADVGYMTRISNWGAFSVKASASIAALNSARIKNAKGDKNTAFERVVNLSSVSLTAGFVFGRYNNLNKNKPR